MWTIGPAVVNSLAPQLVTFDAIPAAGDRQSSSRNDQQHYRRVNHAAFIGSSFAEEAGATQRHCCIHTSAERSQKAMRLLIHANP